MQDVTIPNYSNAKILVLGDHMLDRYWHGNTSRISPEAPVPVVHVQQVEDRPGGAGNVALNIRSLGSEVAALGVIGEDDTGQALADKLQAAGVQTEFLREKQIPTITKLRVISLHQQLIRLDFEEKLPQFDTSKLLDIYQQQITQVSAVVLSDYGKGAITDPQPYIKLAQQNKLPVLVDPKGKDFSRYKGATLLTPNRKEFEAVVGECRTEKELVEKGQQALQENDLEALLITRGEQGMTLLRRNAEEVHLPARAREVFDVTGAGDTVIAVLAASLAAGEDMVKATRLANIAASIVVGRLGATNVTIPELRRAIQKMHGRETGVLTQEQLLIAVTDARAHGERIVMTNGCFDILHAGHVSYLQKAKQLGDRLIVAVNDDQSVKRLKGPARPINPLARRMAVLEALGSVDWVVPFAEDTPADLITKVLPNVLVKGGDYKPEEVAGGDAVISNGGEVKILNFEDGCSTTAMLESILEVAE